MAGSLGRAARARGRPDEYDDMARTTCSTRWACRRRRAAACALLSCAAKSKTHPPGRCTTTRISKVRCPGCPNRECGCNTSIHWFPTPRTFDHGQFVRRHSVLSCKGSEALRRLIHDGYDSLQIPDISGMGLTNHFEIIDLRHWKLKGGNHSTSKCSRSHDEYRSGFSTPARVVAAIPLNPAKTPTSP